MKWVYSLMALAALLSGAAALLAYSGLFVLDLANGSTQFVSAAAFLTATAGWIVNNAVSLRLKIRDNTLKYIEVVTTRNDQAANLNKLWIDNKLDEIILERERLEQFFVAHSLDHAFFTSMRVLANSYEEMAVAIKIGAVEEIVVRRVFATSFNWYWKRLAPFIQLYRNMPPVIGNPRGPDSNIKIFSHCEELAVKWQGKEL